MQRAPAAGKVGIPALVLLNLGVLNCQQLLDQRPQASWALMAWDTWPHRARGD